MSAPVIQTEQQNENAETESISSLDSLPPAIDTLTPANLSSSCLPANSDGKVPSNLSILVSRTHKGASPRGFTFSLSTSYSAIDDSTVELQDLGNQQQVAQILFASIENWISKDSRNEITFIRSMNDTGPEIGNINFHHWIVDQSRDVIITLPSGFTTNVRRENVTQSHRFELPEISGKSVGEVTKKLYWRRTRGVEGTADEHRSWWRQNLKCVDEHEKLYASYTRTKGRSTNASEKRVGRLNLHSEKLTVLQVEFLVMTFLAVYIKLRKRLIQGSHAGYAGGVFTPGLYAVGGWYLFVGRRQVYIRWIWTYCLDTSTHG